MNELIIEQNLTRDVFDLEIGTRMVGTEAEAKFVKADSFNNLGTKVFYSLFSGKWFHWLSGYYDTGQTNISTPLMFGYTEGWDPGSDYTTAADIIGRPGILTIPATTPNIKFTTTSWSGPGTAMVRAGGYVQISGVSGCVEANGFHKILRVNLTSTLIVLDGVSSSVAFHNTGVPEYALFSVDATSTSAMAAYGSFLKYSYGPNSYCFNDPYIWVGGSTHPVSKGEFGLGDQVWEGTGNGQLIHSDCLISPPAVALNTSTITLTMQFTNNCVDQRNIPLKEASLNTNLYYIASNNYRMKGQIARDLIDVTCLYGSTVEVSYRFNTHCTVTGGFVRQFNELIYRHLASTTREAKTVLNSNVTESKTDYTFLLCDAGAGSGEIPYNSLPGGGADTGKFGLVVGGSSREVDFEDYALADQIEHGFKDGQLYHLATVVDLMVENSTTCSFDIFRYLHNTGSTPVTIKEIALYVAKDRDLDNRFMIARHLVPTVGTGFTIPAGEIGKITYRLSS